MKKITLLLCLALIFAALIPDYAFAADTYNLAKPVGKESYFFREKDVSSALFAVPYTYCVKVIRNEGEWLYVSYAEDEGMYKKLYGYCKSAEFEFVTSPPQNAYLNKTVIVKYTAGITGGSFDPPSDIEVEAAYYGVYRHGADFFSYVLCRGAFCYVAGANDDYPLNVYEEPDVSGGETKSDGEESGTTTTGLVIFIIILAVALVAVAILAFTSKKNRVTK